MGGPILTTYVLGAHPPSTPPYRGHYRTPTQTMHYLSGKSLKITLHLHQSLIPPQVPVPFKLTPTKPYPTHPIHLELSSVDVHHGVGKSGYRLRHCHVPPSRSRDVVGYDTSLSKELEPGDPEKPGGGCRKNATLKSMGKYPDPPIAPWLVKHWAY